MNLPVDNKVNAFRPTRTASLRRTAEARDDPSPLWVTCQRDRIAGWWLAVERQEEVSLLNRGDPTGAETPVGSQSFHTSLEPP